VWFAATGDTRESMQKMFREGKATRRCLCGTADFIEAVLIVIKRRPQQRPAHAPGPGSLGVLWAKPQSDTVPRSGKPTRFACPWAKEHL